MSPIVFEVVESEVEDVHKQWKAFQCHGDPNHITEMLTLVASDYPTGTIIEVRLPEGNTDADD